MYKSLIFFSICITLVVFSCKKEDIVYPNDACKEVVGKWNWIYSYGGIVGDTLSPDTITIYKKIEFTTKGKYYEYSNYKLDIETDYSFETKNNLNFINYKKRRISTYFNISSDTLYMTDDCDDCYKHVYYKLE